MAVENSGKAGAERATLPRLRALSHARPDFGEHLQCRGIENYVGSNVELVRGRFSPEATADYIRFVNVAPQRALDHQEPAGKGKSRAYSGRKESDGQEAIRAHIVRQI
jgi:hypothetical protein